MSNIEQGYQSSCRVYYLNGLNCSHCAGKIEESLKKNENFKSVNFSFATKKLTVENANLDVDSMAIISHTVNSIEDGVTIESESEYENIQSDQTSSDNKGLQLKSILLDHRYHILGLVILISAMALGEDYTYRLPFYLAAYILIGGDVATRAFKNLLKGDLFDENFLMTIATLGAFALGEYFEGVAVMLFYKIGEGFQDYAVDHTRRSIKSLINIKAEYANQIIDGVSTRVDPLTLQVDDTIIIKPGEKIPVDATVITGNSQVDTSALTGESLPLLVTAGSKLLSGAINLEASITARVEQTFKNSTVAKILDMVENATGKKAKTEQFITKFAKVYTPIVVVAALLLGFIPPLLGFGSLNEWVSRSLIFLVISCPCALVLSVPLGYFGGLGAASRFGILIKGGNYLEALNQIDTFVFDKTGTLTKGNFAVTHYTNEDTLSLAAMIELHSNHPIAQAIVNHSYQDLNHDDVSDVKEIPGEGLRGQYEGKNLIVGNKRLMERFQINYLEEDVVGSIVYVAYDNQFIGSIHVADEIKESSRALAPTLTRSKENSVIMLTGDQKRIAEQVGMELGIDQVYSQLLPGDKLNHVEQLIAQDKHVLFIGDGINDAPVLARADIGVAMGGVGSDAAIEAADMVIMNDDPAKILTGITIAKKTRNIVMQNIVFALAIKIFFLTLGASGHANMYQAIFADVGVALIAVLNSMRTLRIKE
jgi:Cd2+/Zn2+-exporting ATPase